MKQCTSMSRDRESQIGDLANRRCKSSILQVEEESKAKTKPRKRFCGYESPVEGEEVRTQIRRRSRRFGNRGKSTILSWLIDDDILQEFTSVHSIDGLSNQVIPEGLIKRDGIQCTCCNQVFSVENFHVHGGRACDKPYESILIEKKGISLLTCMKRSWKESSESMYHVFNNIHINGAIDCFDDSCLICADGGDLICCEKCLSTYHSGCIMDLKDQPDGSWYCPYCVCKFCAKPALEETGRCPQCEKRYHWECLELNKSDLNRMPEFQFCQRSCEQVCNELKNMVGKRNELDEGYSWTLLRRMDAADNNDIDGKWIVCNSKLAVARRLMQECFDRIEDRYTKVDVIPSVVYNCGSNFLRLSYKGFYTAILEKDGYIISTASLRIHGTSGEYRSKGMCKRLMVATETRKNLWIKKFGFRHLDSSMIKELMFYKTVMFHDSVRLQKCLPPPEMATSNAQDANAEQQPS